MQRTQAFIYVFNFKQAIRRACPLQATKLVTTVRPAWRIPNKITHERHSRVSEFERDAIAAHSVHFLVTSFPRQRERMR